MIDQLPQTSIRLLPSVWFLGLSQLVHGSATPELSKLAWLSLKGLGFVFVSAMAAYAVSYRTYFAQIPEVAGTNAGARHDSVSWCFPYSIEYCYALLSSELATASQ